VRTTLATFLAAAFLAACGTDDAPERAGQEPAGPPDVAELVCGEDGPELLTPVVRGHPDGVHVRVRNENDYPVEFDFEVTRGDTGGGGAEAPPGSSVQVVPFAAEEVSLGCFAEALDRVELRVIDPGDELKAADPDCEELRSAEFATHLDDRTPRDPVALARLSLRGRGLRQTDHVERAVSLAGEFPVVRVVRGGRVVAKVTFDDIRPNYMSGTVEMCADFAE
jgi:hypothetical protein